MGYTWPADRSFNLEGLVQVNMPNRQVLLEDLRIRMASKIGFSLATVNLDHLVKMRRSDAFRLAYSRQTHVVADGNPIVWISRLARQPVKLIPGADLVHPLAMIAAETGVSVALMGSTQYALDRAADDLIAAHPGLDISAKISPSFGFDPEGEEAEQYIEELAQSGAGLCILALGAPRQEIFAAHAQEALPNCGFASLGASLDFIAGTQKRAPLWVRRIALEWVWRLAFDPRRLARRYLDSAMILPSLLLSVIGKRQRH